nr:MAG TPA: hypothetical protein [Inoviridae sp.]
MSYALEKAAKVIAVVAVFGIVAGLIISVGSIAFSELFTMVPTELLEGLGEASTWLAIGRGIANNFIAAEAFNLCVASWLAFPAIGFGIWLAMKVSVALTIDN